MQADLALAHYGSWWWSRNPFRIEREQLREMTTRLLTQLRHQRALNEKLAYENALLKRMKFAAQSERHTAEQRSLLEEEIDADLAAVAKEIEQLGTPAAAPPRDKQQPKRQALPTNLLWREIRHEPESTLCRCGCQMKRHWPGRGQRSAGLRTWRVQASSAISAASGACAKCETITWAPGASACHRQGHSDCRTTGSGAGRQVCRPPARNRRGTIFGRAGTIARSTWRNGWVAAACSCSRWWTP